MQHIILPSFVGNSTRGTVERGYCYVYRYGLDPAQTNQTFHPSEAGESLPKFQESNAHANTYGEDTSHLYDNGGGIESELFVKHDPMS